MSVNNNLVPNPEFDQNSNMDWISQLDASAIAESFAETDKLLNDPIPEENPASFTAAPSETLYKVADTVQTYKKQLEANFRIKEVQSELEQFMKLVNDHKNAKLEGKIKEELSKKLNVILSRLNDLYATTSTIELFGCKVSRSTLYKFAILALNLMDKKAIELMFSEKAYINPDNLFHFTEFNFDYSTVEEFYDSLRLSILFKNICKIFNINSTSGEVDEAMRLFNKQKYQSLKLNVSDSEFIKQLFVKKVSKVNLSHGGINERETLMVEFDFHEIVDSILEQSKDITQSPSVLKSSGVLFQKNTGTQKYLFPLKYEQNVETIFSVQEKLYIDALPILSKILDPGFVNDSIAISEIQAIVKNVMNEFPKFLLLKKWEIIVNFFSKIPTTSECPLKFTQLQFEDLFVKSGIVPKNPINYSNSHSFIDEFKWKKYTANLTYTKKIFVIVKETDKYLHRILFSIIKPLIINATMFTKVNYISDKHIIYEYGKILIDLLKQWQTKEGINIYLLTPCTIQVVFDEGKIYEQKISFVKLFNFILKNSDFKLNLEQYFKEILDAPANVSALAVEQNKAMIESQPQSSPKETHEKVKETPQAPKQVQENLAPRFTFANETKVKQQIAAWGHDLKLLGQLIFQENKLLHDAIRLQLIEHGGNFAIDLAKLRSTYQKDSSILQNGNLLLKSFLLRLQNSSPQNREITLNAVKLFADYMGLYFSGTRKNDGKELQERWHKGVTLKKEEYFDLIISILPKTLPSGALSKEVAAQAAESLLHFKWGELNFLINKGQFGRPMGKSGEVKPCFLLAQNGPNVHVTPLMLQYDRKHYIAGLGERNEEVQKILKDICGVTEDRYVDESVNITPEEAALLKSQLSSKRFMVLERIEFLLKEQDIGESMETVESEGEAEDMTIDAGNVARPKKTTEPKTERPNKQASELDELMPDTSSRKEDKTPKLTAGKMKNIRRIEEKGKYKDLPKAARIISATRNKDDETKGEIPAFPNPIDSLPVPGNEIAFNKIETMDDYLNALSERSLSNIMLKADLETERQKVLKKDLPVEYPHLKVYKPLEKKGQTWPLLNRLLKNYQFEDLKKALHLLKLGLSPLLCYEMGLGKTMVYGSLILQKIYQGMQGKHLIVVPKHLRTQVADEMLVVMREAIYNAWQSLKFSEINPLHERLTHALQSNSTPHWDDLIVCVMMFQGMQEELFLSKFKLQKRNLDLLSNHFETLSRKAQAHLDKLEQKYSSRENILSNIRTHREKLERFDSLPSTYARLQALADAFAYHPGRGEGTAQPLDPQGVKRLLELRLSNAVTITEEPKDLIKSLAVMSSSAIVTSYEHFKKIPEDNPSLKKVSTLVLDEVQKLQKAGSGLSGMMGNLIKAMKKLNPELDLVGVTGTPLENNFTELWTLLELINSRHFPKATFEALRKITDEAKSTMLLKDIQRASLATTRLYAHWRAFKEVVCKTLVFRRGMKDTKIHEDWEGLVPTKDDIPVTMEMDKETADKCNKIVMECMKTKKGQLFKMRHELTKLVLSPELSQTKEFQLSDEGVKAFLDKIKNGTPEEFNAFVANSPLLSTLSKNEDLKKAVLQKKKVIAFCESLVVGKVVSRYLKRQYSLGRQKSKSLPKKVRFFNGLQTDKKEEMIKWFKEPADHFKFLALTYKTGAVGFNLPEAEEGWMLERIYNPGKEDQAQARMLRIGHKKHVKIYWLNLPTFDHEHVESILDKKRTLFEIFFSASATSVIQYKKCLEYLCKDIFHDNLNRLKTKGKALVATKPYYDLKETLIEMAEEEELKKFADKVTPPIDDKPRTLETPSVKLVPVSSAKILAAAPQQAKLAPPGIILRKGPASQPIPPKRSLAEISLPPEKKQRMAEI